MPLWVQSSMVVTVQQKARRQGPCSVGSVATVKREASNKNWEQEQAQQYTAKRNSYNRAYAACLEGRGYVEGSASRVDHIEEVEDRPVLQGVEDGRDDAKDGTG